MSVQNPNSAGFQTPNLPPFQTLMFSSVQKTTFYLCFKTVKRSSLAQTKKSLLECPKSELPFVQITDKFGFGTSGSRRLTVLVWNPNFCEVSKYPNKNDPNLRHFTKLSEIRPKNWISDTFWKKSELLTVNKKFGFQTLTSLPDLLFTYVFFFKL